jgi:hypothetical protein
MSSPRVGPFVVEDVKVNLIDTPATPTSSEVDGACSVADLAVVVVSAVEGVEAQTEDAWRAGRRPRLPRLILSTSSTGSGPSFERTLGQLQEIFGAGVAPLELPIGEEAAFHGVADLLTDTAITYDAGRSPTTGPIPDDLADQEHQVHEQLVEGIVVGDDDLMERYLDGETSSATSSRPRWPGRGRRLVFPVVCGSAITGVGIDRLATLICEIGPPLDRPPVPVRGRQRTERGRLRPAGRRWPGVQDHLRPLRRQDLALQGALGDDPPDTSSSTPHPHRREAPRPRRSCAARSRVPCDRGPGRRHRRRPQAGRHADRRHPGPQGHARRRPLPDPEPVALRGDPAPGPRATRTSS